MSGKKTPVTANISNSDQDSTLADRQVFLLTIYKSRKGREAGVYLQASHQTGNHKFRDLASAFAYLQELEDAKS
ncbi:MAG: hypothetical protein KC422_07715 [Trueperaceae bacterium]|nr:hypothetical protein [Trueperaceae bacterium]